MVASVKEAELDLSNFKSSRVRIVILASLVASLMYLTGCCNQQQGQAADGGRKDTKGIVAADKPDELPAEAGTEGTQAEDDKTDTNVVNNIPGDVNPAGAGLTPGEGATEDRVDDSDTGQPAEGENTPNLGEEKEEIVEVSTEDL